MACVLTINAGSSSIRFAVYQAGETLKLRLEGKMDRIGLRGATFTVNDPFAKPQAARNFDAAGHGSAVSFLLDRLETHPVFATVEATGHRVVHGMKHSEPERVTPKLIAELRRITPYAPDHLPRTIGLIEAIRQRCPRLPQVACFDTAFHRTMPLVSRWLSIPRRYAKKGVERYGFHGLSYAYLMEELGRLDPKATKGSVILAHLGNGASLAAVSNGKSMDTSMGFTPSAGLVMSTRSGDLDPGLLSFLARTEGMTPAQFERMVNQQSGLLGISEISSDLRDLLAKEATDVRAKEAVALFCYQTKKWIGAYAAALGGMETLVFAGGIGENAPLVRERICDGLGFLGIQLHRNRNAANAPLISTAASRVKVRVIRTNEEIMIAKSVTRVLNLGSTRKPNP